MAITISGIVTDANNEPATGRKVRLYRRDTGELLIETATGDGESSVPPASAYATVAAEGGTYSVQSGDVVRYGAGSSWLSKTYTSSGAHSCGTAEFGSDPAYGVTKTCQLMTVHAPGGVLSSGYYRIDVAGITAELQRLVLDDDAGEIYNDLIDRVVLT